MIITNKLSERHA